MKVIQLTAEHVKRLSAVDITPAEHVQVIGGRNAQGKTSVLDALWLALGGGAASKGTARPIRDGEESASVRLDLGDLIVTRTWKGDKTALTVTSADGAKYSSPQGILDALVGRLSFDPLEFTRLSARDQVAALLDLVDLGIDLPAIDAERARLYDQRTEIGRQGKAIGDVAPIDPDAPREEQSAQDIIARIRAAEALARQVDDLARTAERAQSARESAERAVDAARAALEAASAALFSAREEENTAVDAIKAAPEVPDVTKLEKSLADVEATNARVRENVARSQRAAEKDRLRSEYDALTAAIAKADKVKADALAKASFPVPGLGFDDDGVTLDGVPFSQASAAEQIRVSLAMAMSLNPKLRVIRILDGSLLDADNLALIADMAREHDYQVWIERVGNADEGAVIIEDGAVAS